MLGVALAALALTALPARAQELNSLIISEIMTNPAGLTGGVEQPREWVELYNPTPFAIDLRGWAVRDSAASGRRPLHVIDRSVLVEPCGYVVLGASTNTTDNGGIPVDYSYGGALSFANSLDRFVLFSPDSVDVDYAQYASAATSAQDGISRELKNPALDNANIDGSNWGNALPTAVYGNGGRGTPRAQNSTYEPRRVCTPYQPAAPSTTSAAAGYRLVSAPFGGLTVGTLAGLNLVQGLPDEFPNAAGPNLFTGYTGNRAGANNGYVVPASKTTALLPGRGALWYMYDAGGPGPNAPEGTSRRAELPLTLQTLGVNRFRDVVARFRAADRAGETDQFYLLGNPFNGPFDLSALTASSGVLSEVFQFYTPETGFTVRTRVAGTSDNDASDDVAVWEGFFGEFFAEPTLPVDLRYAISAVVQPPPPFLVPPTAGRPAGPGRLVGLALDGVTVGGARTHDEAAGVFVSADATDGWDVYDASKMAPLASPYATVAAVGPGPDGAPRPLAQLSAAPGRTVTAALAFTATEAGRYTLSVRDGAPAGWRVALTDAATGAVVALGSGASYTFDSEAAETASRFVLTVTPDAATAGEEGAAAAGFALAAVSPNPASAGARTVLEVREAQHVRAEVVDALGRRVLVLFDGALAAGVRQTLDVGAAGLPAGAYVLRVTGAQFAAARSFSVVR